jgi:phenylacetate-CoA ligase
MRNMIASIYGYKERRKRYGQHFQKQFEELKMTEYLPNSDLEKIQHSRIKSFLQFVRDNSRYYRNIFQEYNFNPNIMEYTDDIKILPILEKEVVRKNAKEISCEKLFKNTIKVKTSGSTGKPLNLVITEENLQQDEAYQSLLYYWYRIDRKNKMAKCAGQTVASIDQKKPPFWVTDYINSNMYFSSYHLTEVNLKYYIEKLKRFNPDVIEGYASSIYLLALANQMYKGHINPKFIRTGSDTLLDYQRKVIEDSFQCKVYNLYGSGENCVMAIECPKGKLHIQMLYGYTELLNDDGESAKPGETARIIATGFNNPAFPLIRYNIGDLAVYSENQNCSCGRGGIILDTIIGRIEDYIDTPDGRKIGRMDHIFKGVEGVINGQIVQYKVEEIIIKIAKDNTYNDLSEKQVIKNARKRLGSELNIKLRYVNEIPKENNGKYKFVLSKLNKEMFGNKYDI